MAKIIKYQFLSHEINHGTEENPDIEQVFESKEVRCRTEESFQRVLPMVEQEAYNGEYTVEDDGQPAPVVEPTTDELINIMLGVTSNG